MNWVWGLGQRRESSRKKTLMSVKFTDALASQPLNKPSQTKIIIITSPFTRQGDDCLKVMFWLSKLNREIKDFKHFCMHDCARKRKHTHSLGCNHRQCSSPLFIWRA